MATFNGDVQAGRDIHITEQNQTYKTFDQMTPDELRQERVLQLQKLRQYRFSRWARIPKWCGILIVGLASAVWLGVYCYEWIDTNGFSLSTIAQLLMLVMERYHPIAISLGMIAYLGGLFILPAAAIHGLLFHQDHIIRDFYNSLRTIEILMAKRC